MSVTASLTGAVNVNDSASGTVTYSHQLSGLAFTGTVAGLVQSMSVTNSATTITLPVSPVQFLYLKNTHASQTLAVTWTPNGGSANPVITLQPGSAIILAEAASGAGITQLQVSGSAASTTIEYILEG